jgi:hypothetical protein
MNTLSISVFSALLVVGIAPANGAQTRGRRFSRAGSISKCKRSSSAVLPLTTTNKRPLIPNQPPQDRVGLLRIQTLAFAVLALPQ